MSAIGTLVMAHGDGVISAEMLDAYIRDFVYMAHPCNSETENWVSSVKLASVKHCNFGYRLYPLL